MSGTLERSADTALRDAMRHALDLAARGPHWAENPQVGCVILAADGSVLAEGWHRGAGTAHAEVDALARLGPGQAAGATAVVTLEPCNHVGRTGPCTDALIEARVSRVVYALDDPNPQASGGAQRLREAGIDVVAGVLAAEAEQQLHGWLTAVRLGRPYVTVKWASSLDGRIAAADGTSQWITGRPAREDVHRHRAAAGAIVAGTGTVLADDPRLTARTPGGDLAERQPLAVVLGERELPADAAVLAHPSGLVRYDGRDLHSHLADLWRRGVRNVFVEGGPTIASAFVAEGLADEYLVYLAPLALGGPLTALRDIGVATLSDAPRLELVSVERLGDDIRLVARTSRTDD